MRRSYLDYAMSVIVGRALPDVRDGLKPVHRRVLYAMHELNNDWNRAYKKSARIVGDVIGKYHPHGDTAVYDTHRPDGAALLAALHAGGRSGQLRFGRRRQRRGDALHRNPHGEDRPRTAGRHRQGNGRLQPNYDGSENEPAILPGAHPQSADQWLVRHRGRHGDQHSAAQPERSRRRLPAPAKNPEATIDELIEIIPAPDFPTAGIIYGVAGVRDGYRTGRGRVVMRATHALRGNRPRPAHGDHRRRIAVSGEQAHAAGADRRTGQREEARRHFRHPRRVRQERHARRDRAQARRSAGSRSQQSVQADPASGHLRHEHGRAGRRPAEAAEPEGNAGVLPVASPGSADAAHRIRTAQGARTRSRAGRSGGCARQHRRVHRDHQGRADAAYREAGIDGRVVGFFAGARNAGACRDGNRAAGAMPTVLKG